MVGGQGVGGRHHGATLAWSGMRRREGWSSGGGRSGVEKATGAGDHPESFSLLFIFLLRQVPANSSKEKDQEKDAAVNLIGCGPVECLAAISPRSAAGAGAGGRGNGWQGNKFPGRSFPCHPFLCQESTTTAKSAVVAAIAGRKKIKRHSGWGHPAATGNKIEPVQNLTSRFV